MWKTVIKAIIGVLAVFCFCEAVYADIVILRKGERIKGLILDDYKDRIILSTVGGEIMIKKPDIRAAIYGSKGKELMHVGKNHIKKGQYIKAYYAYEKALELDPELAGGYERLRFLKGFLAIKTRNDVIGNLTCQNVVDGKGPVEEVADEVGLELEPGEKYVSIKGVTGRKLKGVKAKINPGDRIIAIWGGETAYMAVEEVAEKLLALGQIRLVIERTVVPAFLAHKTLFDGLFRKGYRSIIGAVFEQGKKGLVVRKVIPGGPFEAAGIEEGDLVCKINTKETRYMPMSRITGIISDNRNEEVEVVIQRDITLWRKQRRL